MTFLSAPGGDVISRRVNEEEDEDSSSDERIVFSSDSESSGDSDSSSDGLSESVKKPKDPGGPPAGESNKKQPPPDRPKGKYPISEKGSNAPKSKSKSKSKAKAKPNSKPAKARSSSRYDSVTVATAAGWDQGIRVVRKGEENFVILLDVGHASEPPNDSPSNALRKKNGQMKTTSDQAERFSINGSTLLSVPVDLVEGVMNNFPIKPTNAGTILKVLRDEGAHVALAPGTFQAKATKKRKRVSSGNVQDDKEPKVGRPNDEEDGEPRGGRQRGERIRKDEQQQEQEAVEEDNGLVYLDLARVGLVYLDLARVGWGLFKPKYQEGIVSLIRDAAGDFGS